MSDLPPKLSVVTTLYHSEPHLEAFYRRICAAAQAEVADDFEVILVNDGSPDNSLSIAVKLFENNHNVRIIDLSRNFGHPKAIITGLENARGRHVLLIDSDLEEPPEVISTFYAAMQKENCDMVYGVQKRRKGGLFEKFSGWLVYKIFNLLVGFTLPENIVTARLMTRQFLDALLLHKEKEVSIGGLFIITGFRQVAVPVNKTSTSATTYTLRKKINVFLDVVTAFSSRPLIGIFVIGFAVFGLSLIVSVYFLVNALFYANPPGGWTSLIVSVWLLGGLIISSIGIVGIYISKIYAETKQRPNAIIRKIYEH